MRKTHVTRGIGLMLAAVLLLGIAGCSGEGKSSTDSTRKDAESIREENQNLEYIEETEESESLAVESGKKTVYPLTITTYGSDGAQIQTIYEAPPKKVVVVYQGSIETMLALGLEDHMAAAAGLDNAVPESWRTAFSKVNYLDEFTPSLETVTMLEPDMIFSWGSLFREKTLGDAEGWIDKGVNIYMNTNTHPMENGTGYDKTLEHEFQDILNIGKIFDVQDKAEALVDQMQETIDLAVEKTKSLEERPTALIIESSKDSFTNYGESSLAGDMVTKLNGILANPQASNLGKEDVIAADPDVIFVVYMPYEGDDAEAVKEEKLNVILKDEAYGSLKAVKSGRVVAVMLSEMYASATRTQEGIMTFVDGLYPEMN